MSLDYYEALAEKTDAGLQMMNREHMAQAVERMPPGTYVVTVKKLRDKRSDRQNRFWHGVVVPLFSEHCGYDFDDMKDALALELLPRELVDMKTGEVRIVPGHTSELDTKAFNDLIERAQRLGASMGIVIPDPNEAGYDTRPTRRQSSPRVTHYTDADAHVKRDGRTRAVCGRIVNEKSGDVDLQAPTCERCAEYVRARDREELPSWAREQESR